jgi:hypothetical protein
MFTKSKKLLVLFMLTPLSLLLINSPADARHTWSGWRNCNFPSGLTRNYADFTVRFEVRDSDGAARPAQIVIGNGNSEIITSVTVRNLWYTGGRWTSGSGDIVSYTVPSLNSYTSPRFDSHMTWVSSSLQRKINVVMTNHSGSSCTAEYQYNF